MQLILGMQRIRRSVDNAHFHACERDCPNEARWQTLYAVGCQRTYCDQHAAAKQTEHRKTILYWIARQLNRSRPVDLSLAGCNLGIQLDRPSQALEAGASGF